MYDLNKRTMQSTKKLFKDFGIGYYDENGKFIPDDIPVHWRSEIAFEQWKRKKIWEALDD